LISHGWYPQKSPIKKAGIFAEKPGFKYVIWSIDPELVGRGRRCRQSDGAFLYLSVDQATPRKQTLFDRFSSARTALYTVPVQFRDMFRGKVGLRVGTATPQIPPGL
jgi:hypothetical protein